MILLLPPRIVSELRDGLEEAGPREIGGILMGEHVRDDIFRVERVTIQRTGGTFAVFVRLVEGIIHPLQTFFRATGYHYTRYNYIGEWHSHHSFELVPSTRDHDTMTEVISDHDFGAHFAVLMLARLDKSGLLEQSVTVYRPGNGSFFGTAVQESAT